MNLDREYLNAVAKRCIGAYNQFGVNILSDREFAIRIHSGKDVSQAEIRQIEYYTNSKLEKVWFRVYMKNALVFKTLSAKEAGGRIG